MAGDDTGQARVTPSACGGGAANPWSGFAIQRSHTYPLFAGVICGARRG